MCLTTIIFFALMHALVFLLILWLFCVTTAHGVTDCSEMTLGTVTRALSHACNLDQNGPLLFSPFLPAENMSSERQTKTY